MALPLAAGLLQTASPVLEAWRLWLLWFIVLLTAWLTNPNDDSFRNFLTTLSFQQHLRSLRTGTGQSSAKDSHVLTFSNRVSISFRTPQYKLQSYGLFSTVTMAAANLSQKARRSSRKVDCAKGQEEGSISEDDQAPLTAVFIGAFGKWWSWDEGEYSKLATKDRLNSSILSMEALDRLKTASHASTDENNDSEDSASLPGDLRPVGPRKIRPVKATFRAGQRRASPTTKTFSAKFKPPMLSGAASEPAKVLSDTITPSPPHQLSTELKPNDTSSDLTNDSAVEFAKEEQLLQGTVTTLRQQIAELETSSEMTQHQLQDELDGCRARKRDEEHTKTDLKAKARALEEVKRKAEVDYSEAERRHATAKVNKQQLAEKIERMKSELSRLERKEADFSSRQAKSQAHRQEREAELLPRLQAKKEQVAEQESAVTSLSAQVEALESDIEHHKSELSHYRERSLRRAHAHRPPFVPTQIVPVMPSPESVPPSNQWPNYREFQQQQQPTSRQNSSSTASIHSNALYNSNTTDANDSPTSPSSSLFERRRFAGQMDFEPSGTLSHLPSRTSSLRQRSSESLSDRYTGFAPFGPPLPPSAHQALESQNEDSHNRSHLSLPFFVGGGLTSLDGANSPPLTTPNEGPQSPMTPHQNSLLPAHLFDLLDNDDDDPVPQTPLEVALPPRHSIWSDDAAQAAFNRAGGSPFRRNSEDLKLSRTRSDERSRNGTAAYQPTRDLGPIGSDLFARHPLSLNPGAKAFNPEPPSPDRASSIPEVVHAAAAPAEAAAAPRRGLFATGLRDVWNRASNKTDSRSAAATAALFDADDIFAPGPGPSGTMSSTNQHS